MRRPVPALVLLGLIAAGCGDRSSGGPAVAVKSVAAAAAPGAVTIVAPEYRARQNVLQTQGKVVFNEETLVRINATVTGRVLEVLAKPGDRVEVGHRLLVVDSSDLGAAKADYAKAVADVERAEAALGLARELFEVQAVARKEIRDAENEARGPWPSASGRPRGCSRSGCAASGSRTSPGAGTSRRRSRSPPPAAA
jgi:cobalt-zinc-cadmium efflux system membrane fusion protein